MEQLSLYETMFKRKSVRKFDFKPLDNRTLQEILDYTGGMKNLFPNIKTEFRMAAENEVSGLLKVKAPHYLVMSSENKEGYLTNAGYMLQQMDLYLSSRGLGSCYLGVTQPNKAVKKTTELEFIMVLAFGSPAEEVHRKEASDFKRKALSEIRDVDINDNLIKAARLAPSASNSQPWYFKCDKGFIHAYCIKNNFIRAMVYDRLNKFDMGIALYHIDLAAQHDGRGVEVLLDNKAQESHPASYYYICTIKLK